MSKRKITVIISCAIALVIVLAFCWFMFGRSTTSTSTGIINNAKQGSTSSNEYKPENPLPGNTAPDTEANRDMVEPGNPDAGTFKQPLLDLSKANDKLKKCISEAVIKPNDQNAFSKLANSCFLSMRQNTIGIYALKSIGELSNETRTEWSPDVTLEQAQHDAHTVTHVWFGGKHAGDVECYWDVHLMNCKLQKVKFTDFGLDMKNSSVETEAAILAGG